MTGTNVNTIIRATPIGSALEIESVASIGTLRCVKGPRGTSVMEILANGVEIITHSVARLSHPSANMTRIAMGLEHAG